jgi:spore coat polysaccharide biosynthesis protein SpsF
MSSSRLPAKALLPIAGIPIVVLCAKRASNLGIDVCVATSIDPSDDILAKTVENAGIKVIRGPLNNVLERFTLAVSDLNENDIVIRLTADNIFPDGFFLQEIADAFQKRNKDYLGTLSPQNGLPYGVEAEMFTVKLLREAMSSAKSDFEKEHVTVWMQKRSTDWVFKSEKLIKNMSHLRSTIDSYNDYQKISRIFFNEDNPVNVPWTTLCTRLENISQSKFRTPFKYKNEAFISRFALGTAQLGIEKYGIVNKDGRPSEADAMDLIQLSFWHGINIIDCARGYDFAENRVGKALKMIPQEQVHVITKLDPLEWLSSDSSNKDITLGVEHSILTSCFNLGFNTLPVVLLHRFIHYQLYKGKIWAALISLRERGLIGELGISVYFPEEAIKAIDDPDIKHIQVPFNLLDWRWKESGFPQLLERRPDITVYARSAYLQGVLISPPEYWPKVNIDAHELCNRLDALVKEFSFNNRKELCISYMLANKWIDSTIVGIENQSQLSENLNLFCIEPLSADGVEKIDNTFRDIPQDLLNPSLWR